MTDYNYKPPDDPGDYEPKDYEPRDYKPKDDKPKDDKPKCDKPKYPDRPKFVPPEKCKPACKCPQDPGPTDSCLEALIEAQTGPITQGDKAKAFKAELEAFLAKARTAKDDYTQQKYEKFVKQWEEQDKEIVELLRKLVCAVECWKCVLECYVCRLLYDLRDAEMQLYGDGAWCNQVRDRQDELYWLTRDRDAKERFFNRVKAILAAWEKPAQTIEKILGDNAKLIETARKSDPATILYDVFFRLIPMHLAIAPPKGPQTNIDPKFWDFCACDDRDPLWCCGIQIGERSLRDRLIGPQPKLIDPSVYFKLICCLIENTYQPAKDSLSAAEAEVATAENRIRRLKAYIENGLKNFDKNAKAAIPGVIHCDGKNVVTPKQEADNA